MAANNARVWICVIVLGVVYKPLRTQPPSNWPGWGPNNPPPNWPGWGPNNPPPNWPNNRPMPPPNWPGWWNNMPTTSTQPTPRTTRLSMMDMVYCNMFCDDYDYDRAASSTSMEDLMDAMFGDPCEDCPTRPPTTTQSMPMAVNVFPPSGMNMSVMRTGDNWMMNVWPASNNSSNNSTNNSSNNSTNSNSTTS